MNRLLQIAIALGVVSGFALCVQSVISAGVGYMTQAKVMSQYKGVKLGMDRDAVKAALGNPASSSDTSDDFNLTGDDKMTVAEKFWVSNYQTKDGASTRITISR